MKHAISLFSGAGGLDIGVEMAGFKNICSIELDKHASNTLRHNSKSSKAVWNADIRAISPLGLLESMSIGVGELSLLHGGPPCQSFSQIGKRSEFDDPRGELAFKMIDFAKAIRPRAVLVEQVSNFVKARTTSGELVKNHFELEFNQAGYQMYSNILDSSEYGVPQRRKRVFFVAIRNDVATNFEFPERVSGTKFVNTALSGLPDPTAKHAMKELFPNHVDVTPDRDRQRISLVREGEWLSKTEAPHSIKGNLSKKDTTKFRRLHRMEPSLTLRCGEIFFHPLEDRYITPREAARIHSFPDTYIFTGPVRGRSGSVKDLDQHRQVANSVPPLLGRAVAEKIGEVLCP